MTDYYPLISRAVAKLPQNTNAARSALYNRARNALAIQLRGQTPPLSESEVMRERQSLEGAFRRVESEKHDEHEALLTREFGPTTETNSKETSAYGKAIGHAERAFLLALALILFAVPFGCFFAFFTRAFAPNNNPDFIIAFSFGPKGAVIIALILLAMTATFWKGALGAFLSAVQKNAPTLHRAVESGDSNLIETLLAAGAEIDARDQYGNTALHVATFKGNLSSVATLLVAGANVNHKQTNGNTSLHLAAFSGQRDVAELLLTNRAEVNVKNKDGATPLHAAALNDHKDLTGLLLANGAEVHAEDNEGRTPLRVAALRGHRDLSELLLANGAIAGDVRR